MGELLAAGCVCITDDGRPVMNAGLMRRALQYAQPVRPPGHGARGGPRRSPGKGAMNEGPRVHAAGAAAASRPRPRWRWWRATWCCWRRRGAGCTSRTCPARAACAWCARRSGAACSVTAEATPHHFTLDRRGGGRLRHPRQDEPAAAARRGRGGGARGRWPTAPSTPSPPTTRRTACWTSRWSSTRRRTAWWGWRRRCR